MSSSSAVTPLQRSLNIWGDKEALLIISALMFAGPQTIDDLIDADEKRSAVIVKERLAALQDSRLVVCLRETAPANPDTFALSEVGIDLLPVLIEGCLWAEKHMCLDDRERGSLSVLRRHQATFTAKLSEHLKKSGSSRTEPAACAS